MSHLFAFDALDRILEAEVWLRSQPLVTRCTDGYYIVLQNEEQARVAFEAGLNPYSAVPSATCRRLDQHLLERWGVPTMRLRLEVTR